MNELRLLIVNGFAARQGNSLKVHWTLRAVDGHELRAETGDIFNILG